MTPETRPRRPACYNGTMKPLQDFLKTQGATFEKGRVVSVTTPEDEYRNLQKSSVLVPLLGSKVLRVTGADQLDFVHGQVSNDIKRLTPGEASEGLLLNHKGHALASLRVLRRENDLLIAVDGDAGRFVQKELEDHIIFDAVDLEALDMVVLTLQGDPAAALVTDVLEVDAPSGSSFVTTIFDAEVGVVPSRRTGAGGFDLLAPPGAALPLFEALVTAGAVAAGERALNIARVAAGIATAEFEGGAGVLPQEAGLEHAVSYTKGCYLGQEIMARLEARGKLRRSLQGLKLDGLPDAGARDVQAAGKTVGRLGTVAEHPDHGVVALAVLRNDLEPEAVLEVGGAQARLEPLPLG